MQVTLEDSERQECEVYSRVMGYLRPTFAWNIGKKGEWKDRKMFTEDKAHKLIKEQQ